MTDRGDSAGKSAWVIVVHRKPLSHNAQRWHHYQEVIQTEARRKAAASQLTGKLYAKVLYFHQDQSNIDTDNMSKPVLDALRSIVYADDAQITLRVASRIRTGEKSYSVSVTDETLSLYPDFLQRLPDEPHLLYIEIGSLSEERFKLGALTKEAI